MRIRLTRQYRVAYLDEPLSEIRLHGAGLSGIESAEKLRAFDYIWQKHEPLLADMSPTERCTISEEMDRLRAIFVRRQAKELLGAYGEAPPGNKAAAWGFYKESWRCHRYLDWDLLSGLVLPSSLYRPLRNTARRAAGKGYGS